MKLTAAQTEDLSFPIGCPVWYNFIQGSIGNVDADVEIVNHSPPTLKRGVVESVQFNLGSKDLVYEVVHKDDQNARVVDKLTETELAYAANCPVTITQEDGSEVDGKVLLPKASTSHFKTILYTVMMPVGGSSQAQYVDGIGAKQIKYRKVDPKITCDVHSHIEQPKEITPTSNTQSTSAAADKDLDQIHVETEKEEVPSSIVCADSVGKHNSNKVDIDSSITSNNTLSTYNNADDHQHMHYGPSSMKDSRDDDGIRTIEIKVPVWVQRDDFKELFFHLIGSKHQHLRGKRNTSDIERETGCKIGIFYFDRSTGKRLSSASKGCPMIIRIGSGKRSRNPYLDLNVAREKIQDLLLDFVGRDGCRGRLLYETASSVDRVFTGARVAKSSLE